VSFLPSDLSYPDHVPEHVQSALRGAELIHDKQTVESAVDRVAVGITADLQDADPVLIAVLHGGLTFAGMLMRRLVFPLEQGYVHVGRYADAQSGGDLRFKGAQTPSLKGRNVLLVDDILDQGTTLQFLRAWAEEEGATGVHSACLVEKQLVVHSPSRPAMTYAALQCEDRFLIGCGMDYAGYGRNLPGIFAVAKDD